ncbi:hypothetical protein ACIPYQ_31575 [Streptomyces sp. NPDC090045]|uniref:hypothetical protein n=1 Tax=Streptomyces sp. NPDC090045 TaxID=3365927 RepID=UPI00381B049D
MTPNSSRLLRTARLAAPAVAALAMTMALAGPAAADPSFVMRSGGEVRFAALPGEQNTVTFSIGGGGVVNVTDSTSTITAGPGCVQQGPNAVRCGVVTGLTRIQAALGNGNDVATNNTPVPSDMDGGSGEDRLIGGTAADRLTDSDGWNANTGSTTTFEGNGGNDTLVSKNGGFDRITCGTGFDILVADQAALDTVPAGSGCEFVIR